MTRQPPLSIRNRRPDHDDLSSALAEKLIGQDAAIETIAPYVQLYNAGLAVEGRPVGVFLLLGPTGTGKTRTVEALAEALHGSEKNVLRIDCGEFQMEHEVAKLIGAPPGYLGHRETQPMLNQQKLNGVASDSSSLSIVLFDEVEKAASSLARLLLGVLDKASLKLGDNTQVNFERSLIFMTSNLGARDMLKHMREGFGFSGLVPSDGRLSAAKLESIALRSARRRFAPEFINRIDCTITYQPLTRAHLERILALQLSALKTHVQSRLMTRAFDFDLTPPARDFILEKGTSLESGARELKRVIHRHLIQPMASWLVRDAIPPGGWMRFDHQPGDTELRISSAATRRRLDAACSGVTTTRIPPRLVRRRRARYVTSAKIARLALDAGNSDQPSDDSRDRAADYVGWDLSAGAGAGRSRGSRPEC